MSSRDGDDCMVGIEIGTLVAFNYDLYLPFRFDAASNDWKFAPEHVLRRGTPSRICAIDDRQLTVQWSEDDEVYRVSLPWIK